MALLVHLDTVNTRAKRLADAIQSIQTGLSVLRELDGLRAQAIGVNVAAFGVAFGIANTSEAQAFCDRWGAIAAKNYAGLQDFLDATLAGPGGA
jgi:hypothetical protein